MPDVLAKPRDHAVICTFGAQLDFFEGPLWRHVSRAHNRIVLADDVVLAGQLADLASGGSRLRHINRHYLATPITNVGSAHAKLLLLVDAAGGTLLVGSGNLGIDGYASRGEVFYRYDTTDTNATYLPEFQAAKDLLDLMALRGYLDSQARKHLDAVWADTPWIWAPAARPAGVRHNLVEPLGDQLIAAVANERVLELLVHAPFHDQRCEALRRLIDALQPDHVSVLAQAGRTSVDPAALANVLAAAPGLTDVQLASAPEFPDTYLHAKFILIRTSTRSITFTGSANLSLAALWRTDRAVGERPAGNIELVTLAQGPPQHFEDLLNGLDLREAPEEVANLDVTYLGDHETAPTDTRPRLLRGTWADAKLTLVAAGELPGGELSLIVAGTVTPGAVIRVGTTYTVAPSGDAATALDFRAVPVWLRVAAEDGDVDTTPVYPYHPASLATLLTGRRDPDLLRKAGSLDLEAYDNDLAGLLDELDATLVIDRHSLWRLARRSPPPDTAGDGKGGPHQAWEDLNFDALRRHPRLAQYETVTRHADRLEATDLQIVLSAITDYFRGFGDHDRAEPAAVGPTADQVEGAYDVDLDDTTAILPGENDDMPTDETIEEYEAEGEEDEERERRRLKIETRNRLAWQRFAERFTKALRDRDFLEVVGPRVALTNAVILNHLLALLVAKGVVGPDKGIGYQIELWAFLFGDATSDGYIQTLSDEDQWAAMEAFDERDAAVTIISAVDLAVQLTKQHDLDALRTRLRNAWRRILTAPTLDFTPDAMRRASQPGVRPAFKLAASLAGFAKESTRREVDGALAASLGVDRSQLIVRKETVKRGRQVATVEVVGITDPAVELAPGELTAAFRAAVVADPAIDYVRVKHLGSGVVATWDRRLHDCWRYDPAGDDPVDLGEPTDVDPRWLAAADALAGRAAEASAA
ncbi:phospholipase D-like domain-containing protein [Modestobacter lapidis]|nr:hypothetical protein [Modestobacter lapidis]